MKISMIAAMTQNRVIGKDNDLPWHLPDDFAYFKEKTKGRHVVMGRKNYESLPPAFKPLPGRTNLVLTRNSSYKPEGTIVFHELNDIIKYAEDHGETELFIIGGGELYTMGLEIANRIYLTEIDVELDGHVYFPEFDKNAFKETSRKSHSTDQRHAYSFDFVIYNKV